MFGAVVEDLTWHDGTNETVVTFPTLPFTKDPAQIDDFMRRLNERASRLSSNDQPIYTCGDRNLNPVDPSFFGEFMPVYLTQLTPLANTYSWAGSSCFATMDFSFKATTETTYEVTLNLGKKSSLLCSERILFADTEAHHS